MSTNTNTNTMTLTVVVEMETKAQAFPITIATNESVEYLRYLIKGLVAPIYPRRHVVGDCIQLWKVAIPNPPSPPVNRNVPNFSTEEVELVQLSALKFKVRL
ncbi:hypothetical protein BGZ95_008541, partial [Linnemannia exigua]